MLPRTKWLTLLALIALIACGFGATPVPTRAATMPVVDDFEDGLPTALDPNGLGLGFVTFNDPNSSVAIATTATPPAPVPGAADPNNVLKIDLNVAVFAGFAHAFSDNALTAWTPQDWSAYEGLSFWFYGNNSGTAMFVDVLENREPGSTRDDAERWSTTIVDNVSGWREIKIPFASLTRKEIGNGAPNDGLELTEVYGWAFGTITTPAPQTYYIDNAALYGVAPERPLNVGFSTRGFAATEGTAATVTVRLSKPSPDSVTVRYATADGSATAGRDYRPAAGTLTFAPGVREQTFKVTLLDDANWEGGETILLSLSNPTVAAIGGVITSRIDIRDNDPFDANLVDDFERTPALYTATPRTSLNSFELVAGSSMVIPGQDAYERVLRADRPGNSGYTISREFAVAEDWSNAGGLSFWLYGNNTGSDLTVTLRDNQADSAQAAPLQLVWRDEFNGSPGSPPDPRFWSYEIGDGSVNSIPGWGNDELQYYTDDPQNVALDGQGNLVITARDASDSGLTCYYGPCEYTSARLLTQHKFEFGYGRIEARIQVPAGAGLWPAFWSLGNDIAEVSWPQTGEIDIMEFVGRVPNEVFGTIHGPGYSGGQSFGGTYDVGEPVGNRYHVFTVDWQPGLIIWYIDGIEYHRATPDDVAPNPWVFDHSFFLLLNMAVGGNFGGAVDPNLTFPRSMLVDYVRVYADRDSAERFTATVKDNFRGWRQVTLPFSSFERAKKQPDGAPNDGLTLTAVSGYDLTVPSPARHPLLIDQIRLTCSDTVTVSNTADGGAGSLRKALESVCLGGTVVLAPSLAGQTITLTTGPLVLARNVSVDASAAPGVVVSGGGADRVLIVNAGVTADVSGLTLADGYGWQLGGGVLNNGNLTLDRVTVRNNTMDTDAGDFWQGGGGIYSGDGATLTLVDSTVADNNARHSGGGIYAFFNTTTTIVRSTISGNTSNDVGGAIRSLGTMSIENSTISGNTATGWHGGAIFQTDGDISIANSTIANNSAPDWAPSTLFIGQFGGPAPTLTLTNTIISGNRWYACEKFASGNTGNVVSGGGNVLQDDTCNPATSDIVQTDAGLGGLADNGGPTLTHALSTGSPAINAGVAAGCPATDQRGVTRPQGAGCDSGAFERAP
jgi:beta-glucanase (GH16 family)